MDECFGKLYYLNNFHGSWSLKIIKIINSLYCIFGETTNSLPNGIDITDKSGDYNIKNKFSIKISSFIVNSYITKRFVKYTQSGGKIKYLSPINIVLDTYDHNHSTTINENCIESIKTILNHPHFNNCKSIKEIERRLSSVESLNNRFN
tara:strand:- start:439 stop:885 length:447 start_codon:yes stop_codon:yes gene_type:complete